MRDLPGQLQNMVMATKGDQAERKALKVETSKTLWSTVCEMLPDENLTTHEMKYVYYGITADGYHPKYSNLRIEVTYQIWMMVEHTNEVFFPQSVREIARKYINEQGFLNTLNLYRRLTRKISAGHPVFRMGGDQWHVRYEPVDVSFLDEIIKKGLHEMARGEDSIDEKLEKRRRNVKDRLNYLFKKAEEEKNKPMVYLTPLLKKKRNSKPSPSSIRSNVERLTAEGVKQVDIAKQLGISPRRVRQIQKGET